MKFQLTEQKKIILVKLRNALEKGEITNDLLEDSLAFWDYELKLIYYTVMTIVAI